MIGFAVFLVANAAFMPNEEIREVDRAASESLSEILAKAKATSHGVKDYSKEIQKLLVDVQTADSDNSVLATTTAQTLADKMTRFDELESDSDANSEMSDQENEAVAQVVGVGTGESETALNLASQMLRETHLSKAAADSLVRETEMDANAAVAMVQGGAEMNVLVDKSEFEGQYQNAKNLMISKDATVLSLFNKAKMKETDKATQLEGKVKRFKDSENEMMGDAKLAAAEGATGLKALQALLKSSQRGELSTEIADTHKAINALPTDEKLINFKKLDKMTAKAEKDLGKNINSHLKESGKDFADAVKNAGKAFKNVGKEATKAGKVIIKAATKAIKTDGKVTTRSIKKAKELGEDIKDLQRDIKEQMKQVKQEKGKYSSEVKADLNKAVAKLKSFIDKITKNTNARVPQAQASINGIGAQTNANVGKATTDLAGAIAVSTDGLDQAVQAASMSTSAAEAEMESGVTQAKTATSSLTSSAATTEAEIGSAAAAASKVVLKVKEGKDRNVADMTTKLSELNQDIKAGIQGYGVTAEGELDRLTAEVGRIIPQVEEPVWAALQSALRRISAELDAGKIQQVDDLGGLAAGLKVVQDIMARNTGHDETTDVDVPELQTMADSKVRALEQSLLGLQTDRERTDHDMKQALSMKILDTSNQISGNLRDTQTAVRTAVGERTRTFFEQLNTNSRAIKKIDGDRMASQQNQVEAQEYLSGKLSGLETELTDAQQKQNAQIKSVNDKIEEINGPKTQEVASIGAQVVYAAKDAISQAIETSKQKTNAQVISTTNDLNADLVQQYRSVKQNIQQQGKYIRNTMQSNVAALTAATDEQRARAEELRFHAKQATQNGYVVVQELKKASETATHDAERMQVETDKRVEHVEKDAENLAETMATDTESAMKTSAHSITGRREQADVVMQGGLKELFADAESVKGRGEAALEKVNSEVSSEGAKVTEEAAAAKDTITHVSKEFAETDEDMSAEIEKTDEEAKSEKENTHDDMASMGNAFAATADRNGAVVSAMAADAGDLQSQRDEAADQIKNAVTAEVQMISTENEAAYTATGGAVKNSAAENEKSEEELAQEEKLLWQNATVLDRHRMTYENETKNGLSDFHGIVDQEQISLNENVQYLDKYERFAHQRELGIVESTVQLLKDEAIASDRSFDEMEHRERTFGTDIAKLMGGEAFQTMEKIMETDVFIQKATADDEEAMSYLEAHEQAAQPFMRKVMTSLSGIHDDMVTSEAANGDANAVSEAKSAGRTSGALGELEGMVQSTGGAMPLDDLVAMSGNSAEMLRGKAEETDSRDNEMLNALQGQSNAATGASNAELTKDREAYDNAMDESGNIKQKLDGMDDDVQTLLNYNEKVMGKERTRLEERGTGITNSMFYGDSPESLIQTSSKLSSLLEKNHQLAEQNKKLDKTQSRLGMAVEDVVKKINDAKQQLRVA